MTGGAGFIGANLCARLLESPNVDRVVALDDLSTGYLTNLRGLDVEFIEGSILDRVALDKATQGCDAIVHLAARPSVPRSIADPIASHAANATGTIEVLEAARRAGDAHVVAASSSSVYGSDQTLPKSEDSVVPRPLSPYAASKLAAESYTLAYQQSFGLPTIAFRFFNVFGPLQAAGHAYAAVVPAFVSAALAGEPVIIHGDGTQSRDFTFVDSVTAVLAEAVTRRVVAERPVNLAFGTNVSLLELLGQLEGVLGRPIARTHAERRPGDVQHSQASDERLRALFPDIAPVGLRSGLESTVAWFRSGPDQR